MHEGPPIARLLLSVALMAQGALPALGQTQPTTPPNLIVILVDDMRWDEFGAGGHPFVETPHIDRLAHEGMRFDSAFHAVPLCSPNRASLLTGQYPTRHGIIDNVARNRASHRLETFPRALQRAGYETAFVGKWHMGNDPTPRPGFDYWVGIPGQGRSTDPELFEDGRLHEVDGYLTDHLNERAVRFLERKRDKPFLLYLSHKAIHPDIAQKDDGSVDPVSKGYVAAERHRGRYEDASFPIPANEIESLDALTDRPALKRALTHKQSPEILRMLGALPTFEFRQSTVRRRAEMLLAVDEGVGRILDAIERLGIDHATAVVFTSDNGYRFGEHGLTLERRLPYEEAVRMPLLIRYPSMVAPNSHSAALISSVDLAPTLLELASVPPGEGIQGRSLMPILRSSRDDSAVETTMGWRESAFIEFYTYENPMPWLMDMDYRAVRSERYKYIHWVQYPDDNELYDLSIDPLERVNVIDSSEYQEAVEHMRAELNKNILFATGVTR